MKKAESEKVKVKIIRPIFWQGDKVAIGEVLEVKKSEARELIANGKASTDLKGAKAKSEPKSEATSK